MEYTTQVEINKPIRDVFALISGLDTFDEWFPVGGLYLGTVMTSDPPVAKGSTYDLKSAQGVRKGVVETFDAPKHLVFKETLALPIGGELTITIDYKLSEEGDKTKLERSMTFDAPMMIQPMLKAQEGPIKAGVDQMMQTIKTQAEK